MPYADSLVSGETKEIDITTSMEIQNGEDIIGYQYLHGTNAEVGGFRIIGTISKSSSDDLIYDLTYIWNDKIDPNFSYDTDAAKAKFARMIPFADPTDYVIRIAFSDKTIISDSNSSGWLADVAGNNDCIDEGEKNAR